MAYIHISMVHTWLSIECSTFSLTIIITYAYLCSDFTWHITEKLLSDHQNIYPPPITKNILNQSSTEFLRDKLFVSLKAILLLLAIA